MNKLKANFLSSEVQPQVFSLMIVTLILVVISIVVYVKVKKQPQDKAPTGIVLIAEQYVMGISDLYSQTTGSKFTKPEPYIFTLISLLLASNLISLIGFSSVTTSYSFTFTLALVAWIGIYVVGIIYHKFKFFKKFLNPLEIIGQFAPLVSLSFRLFGNVIGGATIMYLIYSLTGWIWGFIPIIGEFNLLGPIVAPIFHLYFDIFEGVIQAFVFTLLTMVYWTVEAEDVSKKTKNKTKKGVKYGRLSRNR